MALIVENTEKCNPSQERKFQNLINQLQEEDNTRKQLLTTLSEKVSSVSGINILFINEDCKDENSEIKKQKSVIDNLQSALYEIKSDNIWIKNIVSNLDDLI